MEKIMSTQMTTVDRNKTLEQLEGEVWPRDEFQSYVVQESQRLRKVPLCEMNVENLRLLIGQKIGLPFLVPIALEHLYTHPFIEGNFYPGDLLSNLLRVPNEFWTAHPQLNDAVLELEIDINHIYELIKSEILPAMEKFRAR
jgi:hypothetical protein